MEEEEAIKRGFDIEELKREQLKLAKLVSLKDAFDFNLASKFAAIHTETFTPKELIASIAILDADLNILEERYVIKQVKFPYISGLRAYRELPIMLAVYEKIENHPDVIFVEGHGIAHPRHLGLASHLGISLNKPTIGIAKKPLVGELKDSELLLQSKVIAKAIITKEGAKPILVSPGHLISLKTAVELTKKCIKQPHKLPEPIVVARKLIDKVKELL